MQILPSILFLESKVKHKCLKIETLFSLSTPFCVLGMGKGLLTAWIKSVYLYTMWFVLSRYSYFINNYSWFIKKKIYLVFSKSRISKNNELYNSRALYLWFWNGSPDNSAMSAITTSCCCRFKSQLACPITRSFPDKLW